jgi:hypothetical protein
LQVEYAYVAPQAKDLCKVSKMLNRDSAPGAITEYPLNGAQNSTLYHFNFISRQGHRDASDVFLVGHGHRNIAVLRLC